MKETRKEVPTEVWPVAEVLLSSRKEAGSSLRKMKRSSITQLGRVPEPALAAAAAAGENRGSIDRFARPGPAGPINAMLAWFISHQPAVLFSQNKPATSQRYFSQTKSAPAISHQPNKQAVI
jgi:hypothetical protein